MKRRVIDECVQPININIMAMIVEGFFFFLIWRAREVSGSATAVNMQLMTVKLWTYWNLLRH